MIKSFIAAVALLFAIPIASVQAAPGSLSVGFAGTHASQGTYVDISAHESMNITGFGLNLASGPVTVTIYYKLNSTAGFEGNSGAWTLLTTVPVAGNGQGTPTNISISPFSLGPPGTFAFYIVTDADGKIFNFPDGPAPSGVTTADDGAVGIYSAYESHGVFTNTNNGWGFQGTVYYDTTGAPRATAAVPTLSEWGLIVLSFLVAAFALLHVRRRSSGTAR